VRTAQSSGVVHASSAVVGQFRYLRFDSEGLAFGDEPDVADQSLVEDFVDRLALVTRALRQTPDLRPLRRPFSFLNYCSPHSEPPL
jgi:hypothetical protein